MRQGLCGGLSGEELVRLCRHGRDSPPSWSHPAFQGRWQNAPDALLTRYAGLPATTLLSSCLRMSLSCSTNFVPWQWCLSSANVITFFCLHRATIIRLDLYGMKSVCHNHTLANKCQVAVPPHWVLLQFVVRRTLVLPSLRMWLQSAVLTAIWSREFRRGGQEQRGCADAAADRCCKFCRSNWPSGGCHNE